MRCVSDTDAVISTASARVWLGEQCGASVLRMRVAIGTERFSVMVGGGMLAARADRQAHPIARGEAEVLASQHVRLVLVLSDSDTPGSPHARNAI